jgi:8-oxo-dGTP diphosphatase
MATRLTSAGARAGLRNLLALDIVLLAPRDGRLVVFAPESRGQRRRALPAGAPRSGEALDAAAQRIARGTLGSAVPWLQQVSTRMDGANAAVIYAGLVTAPESDDDRWIAHERAASLGASSRNMVDASVRAIGAWLDRTPIAFRLLPATFTLSELQEVYEVLLGRPLHKASFRRALQSARLVTPTKEWRSEGRGRPAQLFRFAPRARKASRRGVRFDWLTE